MQKLIEIRTIIFKSWTLISNLQHAESIAPDSKNKGSAVSAVCQFLIEFRTDLDRILIEIWSNFLQISIQFWSNFDRSNLDRILIEFRPNFDRLSIEFWSNFGQIWSNFGQFCTNIDRNSIQLVTIGILIEFWSDLGSWNQVLGVENLKAPIQI